MTELELKTMAEMIVSGLAERLKDDDELLERVFPSRPMNLTEASEYTGIPESTIKHKIDEIPHSKIGKRLVFTERGLSRWLNGEKAGRNIKTGNVAPVLRIVSAM